MDQYQEIYCFVPTSDFRHVWTSYFEDRVRPIDPASVGSLQAIDESRTEMSKGEQFGFFDRRAAKATAGHVHDSVSRREFISGSTAVVAMVVCNGTAMAKDLQVALLAQVSTGAFENARGRALAIVNQMTLEEVVGQLVNSAPALPRLGLKRYQYWTEALHGMAVDGPITSFPQPIALGCSWNPNSSIASTAPCRMKHRACHNQKGYGLDIFLAGYRQHGAPRSAMGTGVGELQRRPFACPDFRRTRHFARCRAIIRSI